LLAAFLWLVVLGLVDKRGKGMDTEQLEVILERHFERVEKIFTLIGECLPEGSPDVCGTITTIAQADFDRLEKLEILSTEIQRALQWIERHNLLKQDPADRPLIDHGDALADLEEFAGLEARLACASEEPGIALARHQRVQIVEFIISCIRRKDALPGKAIHWASRSLETAEEAGIPPQKHDPERGLDFMRN
jgi:hypothetical protein